MKYAFFGSPRFARIVLQGLVDRGEVPLALICNPDRPVGRKKIVTPPETKQFITEAGLGDQVKIFQPEKLKEIKEELEALSVDVFIVAAYAKIIPEEVLEIPPFGTVGVHPSPLPLYRGPSPLQQTLLDGVESTGVSIYQIDKEVDHGPVLGVRELTLEEPLFYEELEESLAKLGAEAVVELVPQYLVKTLVPQEQKHEAATFTSKFSTEDGYVSYGDYKRALDGKDPKGAIRIERMIRALTPEPGVWTLVPQEDGSEKRLKLIKARVKEDSLLLERGQWEGKKPQDF